MKLQENSKQKLSSKINAEQYPILSDWLELQSACRGLPALTICGCFNPAEQQLIVQRVAVDMPGMRVLFVDEPKEIEKKICGKTVKERMTLLVWDTFASKTALRSMRRELYIQDAYTVGQINKATLLQSLSTAPKGELCTTTNPN